MSKKLLTLVLVLFLAGGLVGGVVPLVFLKEKKWTTAQLFESLSAQETLDMKKGSLHTKNVAMHTKTSSLKSETKLANLYAQANTEINTEENAKAKTPSFGEKSPLSLAHARICAPTAPDSLGPFYISGMPIVTNLNSGGKPGQPLRLTGTIKSASPPHDPIAGAKLEIWQTDGEGNYHPADNGEASAYKPSELNLRGTVLSGQDGKFSVMTVVPGDYFPRPKHIHYRITAAGYHPLITQHYIDARLSTLPCRAAKLKRGPDGAIFDSPPIYLKKN